MTANIIVAQRLLAVTTPYPGRAELRVATGGTL